MKMEMPECLMLDYLISEQGGTRNPNYQELGKRPYLSILELQTGKLFRYVGTDHINRRTKARPLENVDTFLTSRLL